MHVYRGLDVIFLILQFKTDVMLLNATVQSFDYIYRISVFRCAARSVRCFNCNTCNALGLTGLPTQCGIVIQAVQHLHINSVSEGGI